ncbi:MAG: ImmA/IrrE family metallo-endopeptidase [Magnetococcales bacterium]|nr:ImmA/IrrE family metallo-endopeptidase [Magnetococcales bacterium]
MRSFLRRRHGVERFPITTEDLQNLIEEFADDLDSYADLSDFGDDVEGMTAFFPDRRPTVLISDRLASDARREKRLRTTLAHEFGHLYFHRQLWDEKFFVDRLFGRDDWKNKAICKRETILEATHDDWMEWQAGYVSGALLMPISRLRPLVEDVWQSNHLVDPIDLETKPVQALIQHIKEQFAVSGDAARVRLLKLNAITDHSSADFASV